MASAFRLFCFLKVSVLLQMLIKIVVDSGLPPPSVMSSVFSVGREAEDGQSARFVFLYS